MKKLITIMTLISCVQFSFAQDRVNDTISKAVEETALILYNPKGDNDLLVGQVKRQIFSELENASEVNPEEAIKALILETQKENKEHAVRARQAYERLLVCEEALGDEFSKESFYVKKYSANDIEPIQEGVEGKSKQLTVEVFVQANLVGRYAEYVIKSINCMKTLKELVKKARQENKCDNDAESIVSENQASVKQE